MDTDFRPGIYEIVTATGSLYELVLGEKNSLRRLPKAVRPAPTYENESGPLRRDNEAIEVLKILRLEVGAPAGFILDLRGDDIVTVRETSLVQSIQRTGNEPVDLSSLS